MLGRLREWTKADQGAIAPTAALSLFALIGVGGIAFDYARLAAMDTELQQAADQAALAAATQLDGGADAMARAEAAARNLLVNQTRFSNDGGGLNVGVAANITATPANPSPDQPLKFYATKADAEADSNGWYVSSTTATANSAARFVRVKIAARAASYALTPVVGALSSGNINAEATAGLGTAICKVPPVMICNPDEVNATSDFDVVAYVGRGLRLTSVGANGGWAPGNFGYLNTGGGSNGVPGLQEALGWTSPPGDCLEATGVDTKPGANVPATDAVNTRFDIYDSNSSCQNGGTCPASINSIKDVVRPANASGNNACALHNNGWQEGPNPYLPSSASTPIPDTITPGTMGHPRDMCHAYDNSCAKGRIGDAKWDRDAYFRTNYGWNRTQWETNTGLTENAAKTRPTRYEVYDWEITNRGRDIGGKIVLGSTPAGASGNTLVSYGSPVCSSTEGRAPPSVPGGTVVDRRRFSVAVVNCTSNSVNGNSTNVPVRKWIEIFVVEPSLQRAALTRSVGGVTYKRTDTGQGDLYVEIIGETTSGGRGSTSGQVVRRDTPYLVR